MKLGKECTDLAESIAKAEGEIASLHTQYETAAKNEQAKQVEIDEKKSAAAQFDQDKLAQRRCVLVAANQVLGELKTNYTRYSDLCENIAAKEQKIATIKADIATAEEDNAKAVENLKKTRKLRRDWKRLKKAQRTISTPFVRHFKTMTLVLCVVKKSSN